MPSYELIVQGEFSAAHQLRMYDGQLEPLHGHNWKVELFLAGPSLDRIGVLTDFTVVQARLGETLARVHDRFLNELPAFKDRNPSAENVAAWIYETMAPGIPAGAVLSRVRVWEAVGCAATYVADASG